jgi:hypothetical protein
MRDFSALGSASMNSDIKKGNSGKGFMKVRAIVLLMGGIGLFKKDIAGNNDITAVTDSVGTNADIDLVVE